MIESFIVFVEFGMILLDVLNILYFDSLSH